MGESHTVTASSILAAATSMLTRNGYQQVATRFRGFEGSTARIFEDEFAIVGLVVFETVSELLRSWTDLQGSLVQVISQYVGIDESKAWDGYLVLLSPSTSTVDGDQLEAIRYDTTRVRKIVSTGREMNSTQDVERVLSGLVPLTTTGARSGMASSALDVLPAILENKGIPAGATKLVIDAFRDHAPMLEHLHSGGYE